MTGPQFWDRVVLWAIPAIGGALLFAGRQAIAKRLGAAAARWWGRRRDRKAKFLAMLEQFGAMRDDVAGLRSSVGLLQAMVRAQSDLATEGSFECDPRGSNEMVNRTYARLLGVGQQDLLGNRWKDYIHPDDAVMFLEANAKALAEHRVFHKRVRMVRSDGDVITVDVTILPHPETPPATRWFGKVSLVA